MLAYTTIAGMMCAGYAGAPWWTIAIGVVALTLLGTAQFQPLKARLVAVGGADVLAQVRFTTLANATLTTVVAFAVGQLLLSPLFAGFESQLRMLLQ